MYLFLHVNPYMPFSVEICLSVLIHEELVLLSFSIYVCPCSYHGFLLIQHIYVIHDPIWIDVYELVTVVVPFGDLIPIMVPFESVDVSLFCCLMLINIYDSHLCYSPQLSWHVFLLFVEHIHRC